jgi:hypothetical protein
MTPLILESFILHDRIIMIQIITYISKTIYNKIRKCQIGNMISVVIVSSLLVEQKAVYNLIFIVYYLIVC